MRASRIVLAVLLLSFFGLALFYVPRLTNPLWSDIEFTGWVSPIAARMVEGQRIYRDFTLPIPPASFALLAGIQSLRGRALLLDELWLCASMQVLMLLIGYAMVRPFTSARNAVLATVATAPILIAAPKEIAYDHTALVPAWAMVALLSRAFTTQAPQSRQRLIAIAGLVASTTLVFKSSTGMGTVAGSIGALLVITWIAWRRQGRGSALKLLREWRALFAGLAAGAVVTAAVVLLVGGSIGEFIRVVFIDGPELKGGRDQALLNLFSYAVFQTPVHLSLLTALMVAYLLVRTIQRKRPLHLPEPEPDEERKDRGIPGLVFAVPMSLLIVLTFGAAVVMLWGNAPHIPGYFQASAAFGAAAAMMGLLLLVVYLATNFGFAQAPWDRRSAFAAVVVAAGITSLMHNLSDPKLRPFYDNNPIIPLALMTLLVILDQAGARVLKACVVALMLTTLFGPKFQRYLDARHKVQDDGFWSGLRVTSNGQVILKAALRARELAGPSGSVLMLPEDPMVEMLVGRARPELFGAIVFVDQYPREALARDQNALANHPPTVVMLHPREPQAWHEVYRIWSLKSPAAKLQTEFMRDQLDSHYRLDSTYDTWLFHGPAKLGLFVRNGS